MGLDLAKIVPSVLFGFLIAGILTAYVHEMGDGFGDTNTVYENFDTNLTLRTAQLITNTTESAGASTVNTFFPGVSTIFQVWGLTKAVFFDIGQSLESLILLSGGNSTLVLVKTIIVVCLGLAVAWIVLMALFRVSGFKL